LTSEVIDPGDSRTLSRDLAGTGAVKGLGGVEAGSKSKKKKGKKAK
jgi:hypothetical protein